MATPTGTPALPPPLFRIDTTKQDEPNDFITVDGVPYDLLRPHQVSIAGYVELLRICPRFEALMGQDRDLTDAETEEIERILLRIVRLILRAPEEVHARLTGSERLQIAEAFTTLSRLKERLPARANQTTTPIATRSTGPKKRRGSAASSRARRRSRG